MPDKIGVWTVKELATKIELEGGVLEFFLHYTSPEDWAGTSIAEEVKALSDAYDALEAKLGDLGMFDKETPNA